MSGRRAKALRAQFRQVYERGPRPAERNVSARKTAEGKIIGVGVGRREPETLEDVVRGIVQPVTRWVYKLIRPIYDVKIDRKSEWRAWKREGGRRLAFEIRMGYRHRTSGADLRVLPAPSMDDVTRAA